jgi:diguanylate cyclase (GGDEF)-like protein
MTAAIRRNESDLGWVVVGSSLPDRTHSIFMTAVPNTRLAMSVAVGLWLVHAGVIFTFNGQGRGPLLSDLIQLVLGGVLIYSTIQASRRSEGLARSFWRLAAAAYALWFIAQAIGVYHDLVISVALAWTDNLLFSFWFAPLAMAIVLDPEREAGRLDTLIALDLVQAVMVCLAAYLYFFYLPKAESGELLHEVWTPYFAGYGAVAGAFLLRAVASRSRDSRTLFGRMGSFLVLSGCVDALYYYGPERGLGTGAWFDLLWSMLLVIPLAIVLTWKQEESSEFQLDVTRREKRIYTEIFHLVYPLLVLSMSLRIAREHFMLAAIVVLPSFLCSSARLLVTQHRLLLARESLRREAANDSLTGLCNHKTILEILGRELLRSERDGQTVGVIMADVDHFKVINDTRGHAAGDVVLQIISTAISAVVRPYDSVGRYGGEEFLIVVPGCTMAETWELAERVRSHVEGCSIVVGGSKVQVSLSLGIATGHCASDLQKMLHTADAALYLAKNAGRNRVEPRMQLAAGAGSSSPVPARSDFWL